MPTPDNEKNSAVDKVLDAFRARRGGAPAPATPDSDAGPATEVVKLEADEAPRGGNSESPTQAFAVPAQVRDAAAGADAGDEQSDSETADGAPAEDETTGENTAEDDTADEDTAADETAEDETAGEDTADQDAADADTDTDTDTADEDPADQDSEEANAGDEAPVDGALAEVEVVSLAAGAAATPAARTTVEGADPDALERTDLVEQSLELTGDDAEVEADDEAEPTTEEIAVAPAGADAPAEDTEPATTKFPAQEPATESPTDSEATTTKIPAAAAGAAAGAAGAAAAGAAAKGWAHDAPKPQVIAGSEPKTQSAEKRDKDGRSKWLLWSLLALVVVIAVVVGIWYFVNRSSDSAKAADAAEDYQTAMSEGDLDTLRTITCGTEHEFYQSVDDQAFANAYQSQKTRNQMMKFKDVTAVAIDGDTARVGVEVFSSEDPGTTSPAQITLHKVDGDWKVCAQP